MFHEDRVATSQVDFLRVTAQVDLVLGAQQQLRARREKDRVLCGVQAGQAEFRGRGHVDLLARVAFRLDYA